MTTYLRTIVIRDGYRGHTIPLYLCEDATGVILGVHSCGWITYSGPQLSRLPEVA